MPNAYTDKQGLDWVKRLPSSAPEPGGAKGRYIRLEAEREPHLTCALENAWNTIPSRLRPEGWEQEHDQPWQSAGAEGVSHLAAKFNITLFPPQGAFFRLEPDALALRQAEEEAQALAQFDPRAAQAMPEGLVSVANATAAMVERAVMRLFDVLGARARMHEALVQLIIAGNALMYIGDMGTKVYQMDRYVINRDGEGAVTEIIVKEMVDKETLPKAFLDEADMPKQGQEPPMNDVEIYTWVKYDYEAGTVYWWQEYKDQRLPNSSSVAPMEGCPWIPMRFSSQYGEDWGEGMVRMLLGDLNLLDGMRESTGQGYTLSSRFLYLTRPGNSFSREQLKDAENGDVLVGDPDSVGVLQGGKSQDLAGASAYEANLEQRLQRNFGMPISVQRKGERVSAAEFSLLASQLEAVTVGFYSLFSYEVQTKIVERLLHILVRKGRLNVENMTLPSGEKMYGVNPITGLAALGRNDDYRRLMEFVQSLQSVFGPENIGKYINLSELSQRLATASGLNSDNLVYSKEEIEAREQAEMQAQQEAQQRQMDQERALEEQKMMLQSPVMTEALRQDANASSATAQATRQSPAL